MKYQQCFDRLGNPCYRRTTSARVHRILQIAGLIAIVVLLGLLYRPH